MQDQRERGSDVDVVAVFNDTPDALLMLRLALEHAGFIVISAPIRDIRDEQALDARLGQHRPKVVVYDVAPPYEAEWALLQRHKSRPSLAGCRFVLTSTHKPIVRRLTAGDSQIFRVIGTPYELQHVVRAVRTALKPAPPG